MTFSDYYLSFLPKKAGTRSKYMTGEKQAVKITLRRSGFDILMDLRVDQKIENFFKQASLEGSCADNGDATEDGVAKTSTKWVDKEGAGLQYYVKNRKLGELVPG